MYLVTSGVAKLKTILSEAGYSVFDDDWQPNQSTAATGNPVILLWGPRQDNKSRAAGFLDEDETVHAEVLSPRKSFWDGLAHLSNHRYRILAVLHQRDRSGATQQVRYLSATSAPSGNTLYPASMVMRFALMVRKNLNNVPTMEEANNV